MTGTFPALLVHEPGGGARRAELTSLAEDDLPSGDVTVEVAFSSLNYKDGLAVTGRGKVLRRLPMVPGIDLAGTVVASGSPSVRAGDQVLVTGYGIGEERHGGFARRARVPSEWVVPVPAGLSPRRAMAVGTAGFTSMLCAMALEEAGVRPPQGGGGLEVLVTGAAGGVGSLAVALLSRMGYRVAASTGRPAERAWLESLGASRIVDRGALAAESGKPLDREAWAGAIDVVGGATLASVLKQVAYGGAVAACGLAGGAELPTTVLPFILRGVSLLGVESVRCPRERRLQAWRRIAGLLPGPALDGLTTEIALSEVPAWSERILAGQVRGRVVVDPSR
ncbi:MAG TPA: MDR family oxidoreductase [Anaeromyxobacter sp.]|nr:MDR family oxidoreductase [Anaeromyxobacter sp.]